MLPGRSGQCGAGRLGRHLWVGMKGAGSLGSPVVGGREAWAFIGAACWVLFWGVGRMLELPLEEGQGGCVPPFCGGEDGWAFIGKGQFA